MRYLFLPLLICVCFVAGCETAPPKPITALDQTDFIHVATGDSLHLGLRGPYTMIWREKPKDRVQSGNWNLLSAEGQIITLDGQMTVRLMNLPGAKNPYQFRPIQLYAYSTIASGQLDQFERMSGQWYASKVDLQREAGEGSLTPFLLPAARGTR